MTYKESLVKQGFPKEIVDRMNIGEMIACPCKVEDRNGYMVLQIVNGRTTENWMEELYDDVKVVTKEEYNKRRK